MLRAIGVMLVLCSAAHAQIPGQDPDWPCAQRLVTTLEAGSYWSGPVPQHTAWRDDETLFPLVSDVVDRDTSDADAMQKITAYLAKAPEGSRPALFSALVDQTNDQRSVLIARLEQIGRRQRGMGETIAALSNKLDAMGADDPNRENVTGERDLDVRAFQQTQRTIRYACEAPANMERRLGSLARLLQSH